MAKPKTHEEALEQLDAAKVKLAEAKEASREFKKENKIKRNKPVEDEAVAKKLEAAEAKVDKARETFDDAKAVAKELKPRKDRVTKYEYPDDCVTDKDKKRYRAKMRRGKNKEDEPDAKDKPAAKKKVVKKPEAETED